MTPRILSAVAAALLILMAGPVLAQGKKSSGSLTAIEAPQCERVEFSDGLMTCSCPAQASSGSVWGSGPYTADSNICTAARHAGAIGTNGGVIQLIERPGQSSYTGSSKNGVETSNWGSYGSSYDVLAAGDRPATTSLPACSTIPAGVSELACSCAPGVALGSAWGNDPYTADSDICTVALHSGYIDKDGGDVFVLRVQGLGEYYGATSNGVTTGSWGAYGDSIVFDRNR